MWNDRKFRYDFYLTDLNIFIEYDGKQHFKEFSGTIFKNTSSLKDRQLNDEFKNKLAIEHKIKLIRISYSEYSSLRDNLIDIIHKAINENNNIIKIGKEYYK